MLAIDESTTSILIVVFSVIAIVFGYIQYHIITLTKLDNSEETSDVSSPLAKAEIGKSINDKAQTDLLIEIYEAIREGANAFLKAEYKICMIFCLGFCAVVIVFVSIGQDFTAGALTGIAFLVGAITSMMAGNIGMQVGVYSNVRTAINAQKPGFKDCFNTAFRAGSVMGFCLNGMGLLVLYIMLSFYRMEYPSTSEWAKLMECISGYGLGGSTVAMFGRVGGGIYTKAADVGADLVGKVIHGIPEDDPRNPATIADNVGDNVGDIAGMGADLFGSFAEATCAALVIGAQNVELVNAGWSALMFPLIVSAFGLMVCLLCSFVATHIKPVMLENQIELGLRMQLILTTIFMIPMTYVTVQWLPSSFEIIGVAKTFKMYQMDAFACVVIGCVGGLIIGLCTEYYTSKEFSPVLELVKSTKTGAGTNIIYGLSLGYKSTIVPIFILAGIIYISFERGDLYGVALCACGMLSNLATGLTIDAYGPVTDNAGGIAEMAGLPAEVRQKTDALDAAGNTTAAVGKGFAIGSAALVSLALFGAFSVRIRTAAQEDNYLISAHEILSPIIFSFLLIGAMIPYWFSALTMKSVGSAAMLMVAEVERQFKAKPELLVENSTARPDYSACVKISTEASLKEMIAPAALIISTPLITGTFFGIYALSGLLTGSLLSSVLLAISMSNTGGAWDNCKKYIELNPSEEYGGKGGECHKAAVVGDTVGDPLKDTSGPALNIVMKLMAIISLVFANFFYSINHGGGIFKAPVN